MYVFIDTNAIYNDPLFQHPFWTAAFDADKAGLTICIPRVVLIEHQKHYRRELKRTRKAAIASIEELNRYLNGFRKLPELDLDVDAICNDYDNFLALKLRICKALIIDFPKVPHEKIAERAISGRRPFDQKGHNGYFDTLIWESILEASLEHEVLLVSNDNDFGKDGRFHEDLLRDLESNGIDKDRVALTRTLQDVLKIHIRPKLDHIVEFENTLIQGTCKQLNLKQWIQLRGAEVVQRSNISPDRIDRDLPYGSHFHYIKRIAMSEIGHVEAKRFRHEALLISFMSECELTGEASFVHSRLNDDAESNELVTREFSGQVSLEFTMIFNETSGEVDSATVQEIYEEPDYDPYDE